MNSPKRGEVWLVQLDPTRGAEMQKTRPAAVIVPITTWQEKFARWPFMIFIKQNAANGLTQDSCGNVLQVRSVSIDRLSKKIGTLSSAEIAALVAGVALCIDHK